MTLEIFILGPVSGKINFVVFRESLVINFRPIDNKSVPMFRNVKDRIRAARVEKIGERSRLLVDLKPRDPVVGRDPESVEISFYMKDRFSLVLIPRAIEIIIYFPGDARPRFRLPIFVAVVSGRRPILSDL